MRHASLQLIIETYKKIPPLKKKINSTTCSLDVVADHEACLLLFYQVGISESCTHHKSLRCFMVIIHE